MLLLEVMVSVQENLSWPLALEALASKTKIKTTCPAYLRYFSLFNDHCLSISVVLITGGGASSGQMRSVEIYNPHEKTSCSLPELPAW